MRYAVSYTDLDNDLKIKTVDADSWKEALVKVAPFMAWLKSNDLGLARNEALAQSQPFAVKEI